MKDAKGHGSNPRGAHQAGVQNATEAGSIRALMDQAKARGVQLDMEPYDEKTWHLSWIDRLGSPPGTGAAVMNDVHAAADKARKSVMLQPWEGSKKLESYYRAFGYKRAGYSTEDGPVMVRKPGGK